MNQLDLSVVIPAFNEHDRLPESLVRIHEYFENAPDWNTAEIIIVDDGSSDGTADSVRALSFSGATPQHVVVHPVNRGKGAAVRTGFTASSGNRVLLTDADLSAPIEGLEILRREAPPNSIAIGSRAVDRHLIETRQPRHRDLMGRIFNVAVRSLGLSRFHDTQCGFKLFPGDLARDLARVQRIDGFAFDVELLLIAEYWGYTIKEIGVPWRHVEASRVAPLRHSSQMLRDLMRLAWWRFRGLPQPRSSRDASVLSDD